jgi:hypothetical protein
MRPIPKPKTLLQYKISALQSLAHQLEPIISQNMVSRLVHADGTINENNRIYLRGAEFHNQFELILNQLGNDRIEPAHEAPDILDNILGGGFDFAHLADVYGLIGLPNSRKMIIDDDFSLFLADD